MWFQAPFLVVQARKRTEYQVLSRSPSPQEVEDAPRDDEETEQPRKRLPEEAPEIS